MAVKWSAVGEKVREARGEAGWTQARLAEAAEISPRHMSFIETGRARPGREVLLRLARALRLSPRDRDLLLERAGYARTGTEREPAAVRFLSSPEEIQALGDPLRQDLLWVFAQAPRTAKQAAELLGLAASRVYHHVGVLERAGLIELVETRPKRGTVEKLYRATASIFRLDPTLPATEGCEDLAVGAAVEAIEAALGDLQRLEPEPAGGTGRPAAAFVLRGKLRLTETTAFELLDELHALLERYDDEDAGDEDAGEDAVPYNLTLVGIPAPTEGE